MFTAKEAREKVNELAEQEKATIETEIMTAVKDCKISCTIAIKISEITEEWLSSLGFKVERESCYTFISW